MSNTTKEGSAWGALASRVRPPRSPGEALERALDPFFADADQPNTGVVRCSSLSFDARSLYFAVIQAPMDPPRIDPVRDRILANGTKMHERIQSALAQYRKDSPDTEVKIVAIEGLEDTGRTWQRSPDVCLSGHLDGIVEIQGQTYVLELKSMRSWIWTRVRSPLISHQWQATGYYRLFGYPTLFVYENKDTQKWKTFVFDPDVTWQARLELKLQQVQEAITTGTPPPFCAQETEADFEFVVGACAFCHFQTVCGKG